MATSEHDDLDVLLVEDNPGDVRLIESHVERMDTELLSAGIELRSVGDLASAREELAGGDVDLVLLDLGLPDSGGLDTLAAVTERAEGLPIVVLTVLDDKPTAVEAIKSGAQDYLYKGNIDEETLARTMRYAIERSHRERRLRERNRQLKVLTSILRHDVRTDLMVIRTSARMVLENESLSETARERLTAIDEAGSHVDGLIETSREYVDTLFGENEIEPHPVALGEELANAVRAAERTFEDAAFEVTTEFPKTAVLADEMLSSVFRNLLNNAVQHNDKETPRVEVGVEDGEDTTVVRVADNGPGLPASVEQAVFEDDRGVIEREGTGLGLHLVTELVERYGGEVWVRDNEPEGTVFVVELPTAD